MKPSDIAQDFEEKVMGSNSVEEENVAICAEPATCALPLAGMSSIHTLNNTGGERAVFKVESSNNKDYRVDHVYGFIEVGGKVELKITRIGGVPREDKLVIYFACAATDAKDPKVAFLGATPSGSVNIFISSM